MKKNLFFRSLALFVLCIYLGAGVLVELCSEDKVLSINKLGISKVWSGHYVQFYLLSEGDTQYAAYYDSDRNMTVASRKLGSDKWATQVLPSKTGWDSHNYITMVVDSEGQLHVSGNMHVEPLVYFRTEKPGDITTLKAIHKMTGERESRVTYPQFIKGQDQELVFTYRDGSSGKGDTIYNKYDAKSKTWSRLIEKPLFNGQGKMNAYPQGPVRGPDGYWHMTWVWRDSPMAETNHDLSYARSKDLINWETAEGKSLALPISVESQGSIIDPIPAGGGIINGSGKIGFDDKGAPVIAYHKYDANGATQMFLTRHEDGKWNSRVITKWTYRWEPRGGGTIAFDVNHSGLMHDDKMGYYIGLSNKQHGGGAWKVDPRTLQLGQKIADNDLPSYLPPELSRLSSSAQPGMQVRIARDAGKPSDGKRYVLRWETLPINRDRPPEGAIPEPSELQLIELPSTK